ncbi:MAG: hypothetical protein IT577_01470 [Verrucomicrobiae bacterium]|nr:hypothetical protein [Verrucomicrobiae bacterium]
MSRRRKSETGDPDGPVSDRRRLSEVLMEFVGEIVPEDASEDEFAQSVELAVILWNLALLPDDRRGEILWRMGQRASRADDPFFTGRMHELVDLRRQRYGDDRRLVVDYRIENTKRGRILWVTSSDAGAAGTGGE